MGSGSALYVGGLLGPFGTLIPIAMYPELRETFGISEGGVAWAMTAYLVPMTILLFVSGTLGERFGRRRVARAVFVVYAFASLTAALAPTWGVFLAARAVQGSANAFFTPLLMAALADATPPERINTAVGRYGQFQGLGQILAPLAGGIGADIDWRWAFVSVAIVSALLTMFAPDGQPRPDASWPPIGPLLSTKLLLLGAATASAALGFVGLSVLMGAQIRDELGYSGSSAGLILMVGGLAALLTSGAWGRFADRHDPRRAGMVAALVGGAATAGLGFVDSGLLTTILWAGIGVAIALTLVAIQGLAAIALPDNRAGALSAVLAFRFLGQAIGPLVWLQLHATNPRTAFIGAGSLALVTAFAFARLPTEGPNART
jgi:ACDE family multidrug resistance protein